MASKPTTHKRLMVQKLTSNFREAVSIETSEICRPQRGEMCVKNNIEFSWESLMEKNNSVEGSPQKGEVCVKNKYVGINATDVNVTKGKYLTSGELPFGIGLEAVGEIVEVGEDVENLKVGQCIAYISYRCHSFSEYTCIQAERVFVIPEATPSYLGLILSGLTASIGLDKAARIMAGETVLITAAAGGAGHIAVQWAKAADCHVIGTCSTEEKEKLLKDLGCDRVINYKKENIADVLAKEYPKGVNVVWETIGGQVFDDCLKNLSIRGRLIVAGGTTEYKSEEKEAIIKRDLSSLPEQLLFKSAAVMGFLVFAYNECFASYFKFMSENIESGKLKIITDDGEKSTGNEFFGMEGIIRGVEHLHSGKSIGKVIARLY